MKSFLITLIFLPVIAYSQARTATELQSEGFKKYKDEKGRITYVISGDAEGDELIVFDRYGWNSLRKQTMVFELYEIKSVQTLHEIVDGDFVYRLKEADSTYVLRKDFKWSQQAAYKTPDQTSEAILFGLGGQYKGDSTLLEKTCEVWTFENRALQELWIWNGLVLKRKTKLGDKKVISTAKKIEIGIQPEPSSFEIPSYFQEKTN